jgi:hypothetical protein
MRYSRKTDRKYLLHRCFPAIYSFLTEQNQSAVTHHAPAQDHGPPRRAGGPRSSPAGHRGRWEEKR